MFEAHFSFQPEYPVFGPVPQPALTRRLRSHRHQCPLHAWAARGKRKDDQGVPQPHWFVYVEYCRHDGARDWVLIERAETADLDALFDQAQWLELSQIDPQRTRNWLDIES